MTAAVLAGAAAGLAVACAGRSGPAPARLRRWRSRPLAVRSPPPGLVVATVAAVALVLAGPVAALVAGVAAALAPRLAAGRRRARAVAACSAAVPGACRALAAELRAGAPPPVALDRVAGGVPPPLDAHLRSVSATYALGLRAPPPAWSALPGAGGLRAVGALWAVSEGSGAAVADGLDRLAAALADDQRAAADLTAQLAGAQASAAVLAVLPVFGLLLGQALGARPVSFLLGTPLGGGCLVAAAGLDLAGLAWVRRLTRSRAP